MATATPSSSSLDDPFRSFDGGQYPDGQKTIAAALGQGFGWCIVQTPRGLVVGSKKYSI